MKDIVKIVILILFILISLQNYAQNTIKPYNEVISTKLINKKEGLQAHLINKKLYLEIPSSMLHKDMLFVKHSNNIEYKQIKWIKKDNKIKLIIPEIESRVGNTISFVKNKFDVKIKPTTFPILAMSYIDSSYVIDATTLFLKTPKPLPGSNEITIDNSSTINKVLAFDNTVEVKINKTIASKHGPLELDANYSLTLLPKEPMTPRLFDHRMGFGKEVDFLNSDVTRAAITRWRLEKKEKDQVLSEPVNPITFYFDPTMPDKWKPYIKAGIKEWLPAFEAAGFKNAILIKDPPINDENFSMKSVRYSFIRWIDRTNYRGNEGGSTATVSKIIDQRTGEILKGDLLIGAPYELLSDRYFVRCSPLDKRAQQYPFPDDLMGELIQSLTAHEVGHVFGLKDGHYGEFTYSFENMRDKKWLQDMGHTPSIMNYARENFIVQPEDKIPPSLLQQKVGPTDVYSIRWAYLPFQDVSTPEEELPYLEKIVREQDSIPWYRFVNSSRLNTGPSGTNEVVESNNPIKATELGIQNLKRVLDIIPKATENERGDKIKKELYLETLQLWVNQMKSVVSLVGGYTIQQKSGEQKGAVHKPVSFETQKKAVAFLNKEAFTPPLWIAPPSLLRRMESLKVNNEISFISNSVDIISKRQLKILQEVLSFERLKNLEGMGQSVKNTYTAMNLFQDLNEGLWSELKEKEIKINPFRQEIQMAYIVMLKDAIESKRSNYRGIYVHMAYSKYYFSNYIRGIMINTLYNLKNSIESAFENTKDMQTKGHLELCLLEIEKGFE